MHLDLRTLQLFVAVVEEQSVAKAAEREHIAASAVSKRIADLEKEIKVDLFRRHRPGLSPTPAGYALPHHARTLMRDLAQLESELGDYAQGRRGSIRIFANISAMVQYLPADLSRFLTEHPLVRVDLEEAITVLPYRQDRLVVVVPARHPLRRSSGARNRGRGPSCSAPSRAAGRSSSARRASTTTGATCARS